MFKIEKLTACSGAERFGTCVGCEKNSNEDNGMIRICFGKNHRVSVCLCEECCSSLLGSFVPVFVPDAVSCTLSVVKKAVRKQTPRRVVFQDSGYHPHLGNVYTASCPECGLPIIYYTDADISKDCTSDDPETMFKSSLVHHDYRGFNGYCNRCGQKLYWGKYPRPKKRAHALKKKEEK